MRMIGGLQPGFMFLNVIPEEAEEGEGKASDTGRVQRSSVTICPSVGTSRADKNSYLLEEVGVL